jgi:hypothetical protein
MREPTWLLEFWSRVRKWRRGCPASAYFQAPDWLNDRTRKYVTLETGLQMRRCYTEATAIPPEEWIETIEEESVRKQVREMFPGVRGRIEREGFEHHESQN